MPGRALEFHCHAAAESLDSLYWRYPWGCCEVLHSNDHSFLVAATAHLRCTVLIEAVSSRAGESLRALDLFTFARDRRVCYLHLLWPSPSNCTARKSRTASSTSPD